MKITREVRDALNDAYRRGRENGGASCCGTSAMMHLPRCPELPAGDERVQSIEQWWSVWGEVR